MPTYEQKYVPVIAFFPLPFQLLLHISLNEIPHRNRTNFLICHSDLISSLIGNVQGIITIYVRVSFNIFYCNTLRRFCCFNGAITPLARPNLCMG